MSEELTTIRVHKDTVERLGKQGTARQSLEDIIKQFLDRAEAKARPK
jgi:hypothetical protein